MSGWHDRLGNRGKAMVILIAVPLLLPAVAASFHAIRIWADTDQVNPSLEAYYSLIESTDGKLTSLDAKIREEASDTDWQAVMEKMRRQQAEEERMQEATQVDRPRAKAVMLGDLALQGIFWKAGRPIVYVNHELVELNEKVNGWKVTEISKDKMIVVDPEGNERTYDLDTILEQLYPGYRRP